MIRKEGSAFKVIVAVLMCIMLCAQLGLAAFAEWGFITYSKIQLHTYPSKSVGANDVPYVNQNVSDFDVRMVTDGLYITGWSLTDAYGNYASGRIRNQPYTLTVNVAPVALNGVFNYTTTAIVNGVQANIFVSPDGRSATVTRQMIPKLICPAIWHSPTDETHNEGELFSFVASASQYYTAYQWYLKSPYGEQYKAEDAWSIFTGLVANIHETDTSVVCNLSNVPAGMDGWTVWCVFSNEGGSAKTNAATIHVRSLTPATPVPTMTVQIVPEPSPLTVIVEQPAETPEVVVVEAPPVATPEVKVIEWEEKWTSNEAAHWHKSVDPYNDEIDGKQEHTFEWTLISEATKKQPGKEKGVCTVCGYETERDVEYVRQPRKTGEGMTAATKITIRAAIGVAALGAGAAIAGYESKKAKKKRRAKMAGRNKDSYRGRH